jgi:hypothetical protein
MDHQDLEALKNRTGEMNNPINQREGTTMKNTPTGAQAQEPKYVAKVPESAPLTPRCQFEF